jgi:hypothetical protein
VITRIQTQILPFRRTTSRFRVPAKVPKGTLRTSTSPNFAVAFYDLAQFDDAHVRFGVRIKVLKHDSTELTLVLCFARTVLIDSFGLVHRLISGRPAAVGDLADFQVASDDQEATTKQGEIR